MIIMKTKTNYCHYQLLRTKYIQYLQEKGEGVVSTNPGLPYHAHSVTSRITGTWETITHTQIQFTASNLNGVWWDSFFIRQVRDHFLCDSAFYKYLLYVKV